MFENSRQMLEEFNKTEAKFSFPFAMGVFGTLRKSGGNTRLMGKYTSHHKAFMPHFSASGLTISFAPGMAAVFEIFTYTPENWKRMISSVDRLEGFIPNDEQRGWYWYWRTLVYLHLLPDDFKSPFYESGFCYSEERVLPIPQEEWKTYPRVPCWVYSSFVENYACAQQKLEDSPLIWVGQGGIDRTLT